MNPVRIIQMEKRMKQILKEMGEVREKLQTKDIDFRDLNLLVGILKNLTRQEIVLKKLITGKSYKKSYKELLEELRQAELRRQKRKPASPDVEVMMKHMMTPEYMAAKSKEFEDHRNERFEENI